MPEELFVCVSVGLADASAEGFADAEAEGFADAEGAALSVGVGVAVCTLPLPLLIRISIAFLRFTRFPSASDWLTTEPFAFALVTC